MHMWCVAPLEMNVGNSMGARVQSAYRLQCRKGPTCDLFNTAILQYVRQRRPSSVSFPINHGSNKFNTIRSVHCDCNNPRTPTKIKKYINHDTFTYTKPATCFGYKSSFSKSWHVKPTHTMDCCVMSPAG